VRLADHVPRDENQRDEEHIEGDKDCEKEKDFHDYVFRVGDGTHLMGGAVDMGTIASVGRTTKTAFESQR